MRTVRTVAVIGAGPAGRHIARLAALGGYHTILEDVLPAKLYRAQADLKSQLETSVSVRKLTQQTADAVLQRVEYASSVEEAARKADLVIEAVPDEMESKMEIFTLLDRMCRPDTVLVSSTKALRVTDVTDITHRASHCVGLRFGSDGEPLEVVRGEATDEPTFLAAQEFASKIASQIVIKQE